MPVLVGAVVDVTATGDIAGSRPSRQVDESRLGAAPVEPQHAPVDRSGRRDATPLDGSRDVLTGADLDRAGQIDTICDQEEPVVDEDGKHEAFLSALATPTE